MSTPDQNVWYTVLIAHFAEQYSDGDAGALQVGLEHDTGAALYYSGADEEAHQKWQFFPDPTAKDGGTWYVLRPQSLGSNWYAFANENNTSGCGSSGCTPIPGVIDQFDPSARWAWEPYGDGTFKLYNQATGPGFLMDLQDEDSPSLLQMNSNTAGNRIGQHWAISSVSAINDNSFSTMPPTFASATASATPTVGAGAGANSTPSPSNLNPSSNNSSDGGLSTGAAAGIGVGVAVLVLLTAFIAGFFFWRRRRDNKRRQKEQPSDMSEPNESSLAFSQPHPNDHSYYAGAQQYTGNKGRAVSGYQTPAELAAPQEPTELPVDEGRHELSGHP